MSDRIEEFLDIDFSKQPQFVFGYKGPGDSLCSAYEDEIEVLSDADIMAAVEREEAEGGGADRLVTRIYDQKQEGSCVANACCQANEIVQNLQHGKARVIPLSAISLYKRIGRSASSGAYVGDGLEEISTRGVLPLDTPENRAKFGDKVMPNTGFRTPYPAGWEDVASTLATVEYHTIRTYSGLKTALVKGHPVVVGRQGHSICYVRLMLRNGRLVAKYANSWGDWGDEGYGYDTESQMKMSAGECFAVRSVKVRLAA